MDKGIRPACNALFIERNAQRVAGEMTNTVFRKGIIATLMDDFGISLASAATAYNHAFKQAKAANPQSVEGLGRPPEKNNGGRKKKVAATEVADNSEYVEPQQKEYTIRKKSDNSVVMTTSDFEEVLVLMQTKNPRINGKFTGKLYWV